MAAGNTNYKPYYLAEHMKFVLPFTKSRQRDAPETDEAASSNFQVEKIEIEDEDDDRAFEHETPPPLPAPQPPTITVQTIVGSNAKKEFASNPARFVFVPPISSTPNVAVKRTLAAVEQVVETDTDYPSTSADKRLKITPDTLAIQEQDDAADLNFFKSLLPDIRQMTPTQKRKFKMGIFELINNIVDSN